ncbi:hypothetical protein [Sphingomonas sp. BK235]|uniref:hypothetical protein n=1 Tax=Sphingomonas sp. BK235 TaxID=2512131 RepID=UPI001043B911|nr:hypothetical protein [Sphingomonas sp. BK235]TCP36523.1 hypothetical protein EV292_10119 [Sphingomonas sp. BK235]
MGEAKRRLAEMNGMVWHHTSILRTNLIWMSGVIDLEGRSKGAMHPAFGEIMTSTAMRRPMRDFPALAWFTSDINVPKCLQHFDMYGVDKETGQRKRLELAPEAAAAMVLNRMAIGFRSADIPVVPWPAHRGYDTGEGRELNESARDVGDDPDRWWVSDTPVDVLKSTDIRGSKTLTGLKMERLDGYLAQVHQMVQLCRSIPGTYIPPSWHGSEVHRALIAAGKDYRG